MVGGRPSGGDDLDEADDVLRPAPRRGQPGDQSLERFAELEQLAGTRRVDRSHASPRRGSITTNPSIDRVAQRLPDRVA